MNDLIYERDLNLMKFVILKSPHHQETIRKIATHLSIPPQKIRKVMIERLDMMSLEAVAVRYDTWQTRAAGQDELKTAIGYELYTKYIPLISMDEMDRIYSQVKVMIESSGTEEKAIESAKIMILEVLEG